MKKETLLRPSTPLNLNNIATKIINQTGCFVDSDRKEKYDLLNKSLKELQFYLIPFVWLNMNSVDSDYQKTVPVMADMIGWINEYKIEKTLHSWHYQENNDLKRLDGMIKLLTDFLTFIKKELDLKDVKLKDIDTVLQAFNWYN